MRKCIIAAIALAAGCSQPMQQTTDRKPVRETTQTFPLWVNLQQLPSELRPKRDAIKPQDPKLSLKQMAARYEREIHCIIYMKAFVLPEDAAAGMAPLLGKLSQERLTHLSQVDAARLQSAAASADAWQQVLGVRPPGFRLLEGGSAVMKTEQADSKWQRGVVYAAETLEIHNDACRFVFAAQGAEGRPADCKGGKRTWHVADEARLDVGDYAAKLATSPIGGQTVVLLVELRNVRPGQV